MSWSNSTLFFFFQAEDGIRDSSVTGVQTCALPILGVARRHYEHRATADLVAEPPPEEGARNRAETGGKQDSPALPIGQRPLLGQRRSDVSDQKEIKEIEQICQIRRAD